MTGGKRIPAQSAIGVFVPTWAEALPLVGFGPRVTGIGRRLYDLAGCDAVLLAGFAGACRAELRVGDVILSGGPSAELGRRLGAISGELRTIDHVASPSEKAALGAHGAVAVDMETRWLAEAAGVPFVSLRVIIDRLEDTALGAATALHYLTACRSLRRAVAIALDYWRTELASASVEAGK